MSQITIGITDDELKRIDARCARSGQSREQFAANALRLELARPEATPKAPSKVHTAAAPKLNAGADKEE